MEKYCVPPDKGANLGATLSSGLFEVLILVYLLALTLLPPGLLAGLGPALCHFTGGNLESVSPIAQSVCLFHSKMDIIWSLSSIRKTMGNKAKTQKLEPPES